METQRIGPFSAGTAILIGDSATTIHTVPAAAPGKVRGALVNLELLNGSGSPVALTVTNGAVSEGVSLAANSHLHMAMFVAAGTSLAITAGTAGEVTAFGHAVHLR